MRLNIKESTKEGKLKVLTDLLKFLNYKSLRTISALLHNSIYLAQD